MKEIVKKFESVAHAKTKIRYHLIFSTKYRKKCLNEVREEVLESFRHAEKNSDFKILLMELDHDHVHFLMRWKPALSIEQVVRRMKQYSTDYLWKKRPDHFKKYYWGKQKKIWTGGYFVSTIGDVSESRVVEYIKNQG